MKLILFFALIGSISCALRDYSNRLYIGAALSPMLWDMDPRYRQLGGEEFNFVTPENEMKISFTEPNQNEFTFERGDEVVAFARQNNQTVRGHNLVWHVQPPAWITALTGETLLKATDNHIEKVVGHYKGQLYAWDVVNEVIEEDGTLRDSVWSRASPDFVARAFRKAYEVDPNVKLYINDYDVEGVNVKSNGLYNLVKKLLADGVPVHGVGFQCHFTLGQVPNITDMQSNMQRFADLGVEVAVTELDVQLNGQSEEAQAEVYAEAVTACANVPQCVGVTMWGLSDKYSWASQQSPLPWDGNYREKPAVAAIEKALV